MPRPLPLAGASVLEHGTRVAVSACGSVLEALGAAVTVAAIDDGQTARLPPAQREGKSYVTLAAAEQVAQSVDIVVTSSDVSRPALPPAWPGQITCDITAYGSRGPMAGLGHSDALVQAFSGLADTTGEPDAPPTLCPFPQTGGIAALYAAAGILSAVYERGTSGLGQAVEIAMFDCAFSTLSTFLPFHFIGKSVTRAGNRHVLASPWNAYRAADGWLLVCTGSDEQWKRLCEVMRRPDLAGDARLGKASDRVQERDRVDGAVQAWLASMRTSEAAHLLQSYGIAAGEIVAYRGLGDEPNIAHRRMVSAAGSRSAIRHFAQRPHATDADAFADRGQRAGVSPEPIAAPLEGLAVLEIGQYTTAPLVARTLGALGATVSKIEPPGGDATRAWPPQREGQGYFFTLSNSDKQSLCLDLRASGDRARFRRLAANADVLVENLKPGSLDKLGFDPAWRNEVNPRLVYCAISGFGADSAYPGRPAFDTVIQAVSGIMDLVRVDDVPQKTGISFADILGGSFALIGTLAALVARQRTGAGDAIDLSMQDAAAWITQWTVADPCHGSDAKVIACSDGFVAAQAGSKLPQSTHWTSMPRSEVVAELSRSGVAAAPVQTISEVAECEHARVRNVLAYVKDSTGREWPVFTCPIRLSRTPARARRAIGPLGEASGTGV